MVDQQAKEDAVRMAMLYTTMTGLPVILSCATRRDAEQAFRVATELEGARADG